jgi:Flp pilus assembly protein TadD
MLLQLENDAALDIPPGDANFTITDELTFPVAVSVLGVYPHAHYLGKRLEAWADIPDGTRKDLILIPDWDIDRQSVYRLAEPLPLPAGTVVHMRYTYDNSAANPRNPHAPPVRVKAGNRSEDEMGHLWLQVLPAPAKQGEPDPRLALERAWMQNRLRKSPDDQIALYNLAAMATESGDNAQAISIYRRILSHRPDDARTLTSLGAALVAEGDWQGGSAQFHAALKLDPAYTDAAFDLASIDIQHEQFAEAEQLLTQLTSAHPQDAQSLRLLAMAYASDSTAGQLAKALTPLQAWVNLSPMDPEPRRALAQVYAQLGQPAEALREQRAVVALAASNASDWNDLGVMEARAGNPAAARKEFTHALELDPTLSAARINLSKL